jgi:hypothetical protein
MAASNDNQGLKIAVAALATFTVLFASTTYYFYSESSKAISQADSAKKAATEAAGQQATSEAALKDLGVALGYANLRPADGGAFPDIEALKSTINATVTGLRAAAEQKILAKVKDAPAVKQEMTKNAELGALLEDQRAAASRFLSNPSADLRSQVENLTDLLKTAVDVEAEFFIDNYNLRKSLTNVNATHEEQLKATQAELEKIKQDLAEVQKTHETGRVDLTETVETARREANTKETELAAMQGTLAEATSRHTSERADLVSQLREIRDRTQRKEDILDTKDGAITFVDHSTKTVRMDVNRAMGVRPTMRFTIFDRKAVGIPTDKPKGQVEVTEVGTQYSIGRIIETKDLARPIVAGDLLYSAGWNASEPQLFALIGPLDLDRDGKDDRGDISQMIRSSGGEVSYDLQLISGEPIEKGKLSARIAWYVDDDRDLSAEQLRSMTEAQRDFMQRKNEVLREARSLGIRPLPLSRLPGILGYTLRNLRTSPVEGVDPSGLRKLTRPAGRSLDPAPAAPDDPNSPGTPPVSDNPTN